MQEEITKTASDADLFKNLQLDCHPDVTNIVYGTKSAMQIDVN